MDADKFSNDVSGADASVGDRVRNVFLVLGLNAYGGKWEYFRVVANFGVRVNNNMGSQNGISADSDIGPNGTEGANDAIFAVGSTTDILSILIMMFSCDLRSPYEVLAHL